MMKVIGISSHSVEDAKKAPQDAVYFVCDDDGNVLSPAYSNPDSALGAIRALMDQEYADIEYNEEIEAAMSKLRAFSAAVCAWGIDEDAGEVGYFGDIHLDGDNLTINLSEDGAKFINSIDNTRTISVNIAAMPEPAANLPNPFRKQ